MDRQTDEQSDGLAAWSVLLTDDTPALLAAQ